ncbi:hypothetical protein P3S68_031630 [Capsicum galapagoense]
MHVLKVKLTLACRFEAFEGCKVLTDHTSVVMSVLCWDQFLLSCSPDKTIKVWAANESGNLEVTYTNQEERANDCACSFAGGAKKKRLFGLGSEAISYFGKKLCACNASTSSVPPSVSLPTTNMEEFVKQLIPALTTHFLPVVFERVGGIRVQEGAVLDPPTNDDDVDS